MIRHPRLLLKNYKQLSQQVFRILAPIGKFITGCFKIKNMVSGALYAIFSPIGMAATVLLGSSSLDSNTYYSRLAWGRRVIDIPLTFSEFLATALTRSVKIVEEYNKRANQSWSEWWDEAKIIYNPKKWSFSGIARATVWLCSWSVLLNVLVSTFQAFCLVPWLAAHEWWNFGFSTVAGLAVSAGFDTFIGNKVIEYLENWKEMTQITRTRYKYPALILTLYGILTVSAGQGLFSLLATTRGLFLLNRLFFKNYLSDNNVLIGGVGATILTVFTTALSRGLSLWKKIMQPSSSTETNHPEAINPEDSQEIKKEIKRSCCTTAGIITTIFVATNWGNALANGLKTTAGGEDFLDYRGWFPELENLTLSLFLLGLSMAASSITLSGDDIEKNLYRLYSFLTCQPPATLGERAPLIPKNTTAPGHNSLATPINDVENPAEHRTEERSGSVVMVV